MKRGKLMPNATDTLSFTFISAFNHYIILTYWASLSEPHIDHDNGPPCGIMICIYVFMYHLPCVCHVTPRFPRSVYTLKCSVYSGTCILTCSCAWFTTVCTRMNSKDDWSYSCLRLCREDYWRRQVGECADTWYKRIQPTGKVEL